MSRHLVLGLLMILIGGGDLRAQAPELARTAVRLGVGPGSADYTCSECHIDAVRGASAFLAAGRSFGRLLTVGLEASVADASSGNADPARFLGALATAGVHGSPRLPVWGSLGLGWAFWSGPGPNANGPALSARAGVDLPLAARVALTPYVGYVTMLGHHGPQHVPDFSSLPEGVPTRLSSLQLGVAATLRL
jgi:hypothetical protein